MSDGIIEDVRKAVETAFNAGWGTQTPVRWPNVPFKQPKIAFVSVVIQWGSGDVVSLGTTKREEQSGLVVVTVNIPQGEGAAPALGLAAKAQAIFRALQLTEGDTTINFYECSVGAFGESTTGYSGNAYMRFKADRLF